MKIYIDSSCDINYASFYLEGIRKLFGMKSVQFTSKYFKDFKQTNHFVAFVIKTPKNQLFKVIIDFADMPDIKQLPYDWCDIYAKVNLDFEDQEKYDKSFPVGPGFGIKVFSIPEALFYSISNFIKSGDKIKCRKRFFSEYRAQLKRFRIKRYVNSGKSKNDYLYFVSSLWKKETDTNIYRSNFIKASKNIEGIHFEGGFAPRSKNDIQGFEALTIEHRDNFTNYINNTKSSLAAFNTPAVLKCHGWKLGEFLALGKAIISTPISRALPSELTDRQQILITDGTQQDIEQKIKLLLSEPKLKETLEKGAQEYFNEFLAPEKVVSSIFKKLNLPYN